MRLLIIQNDPLEPPGMIADYLDAHNHPFDIYATFDGYDISTINPDNYDALIVMGGRYDSWDARYDELRRFIASWVEAGKGYLGVCLGAQMLALAMGGVVKPGAQAEVGNLYVERVDESIGEEIMEGFEMSIPVLQWHQDYMAELPPGASNLLSSDIIRNQLIKVNNKAYGMQFHWDIGTQLLNPLCAEHHEWLLPKGINPDTLKVGMKKKESVYRENLYIFLTNWFWVLGR